MDNYRYLQDDLDIQLLILFVLSKLPGQVDTNILAELVMFDGGVNWFDFSQGMAKLLRTENVLNENGTYEISEKGRHNIQVVETSLPFTLRSKAERLCAPVAAAMKRSSMIETDVEDSEGKKKNVSLRLSDGAGEIVSIRVSVPMEQTDKIQTNFKNHAEDIYNQLILLLTGEFNA